MSKENNACKKPVLFGGQALMEGVMMQGNGGFAMAVRTPSGDIVYKNGRRKSLKEKYKLLNVPIIRGLVSFGESMLVGFSSLSWSAFQAGEEEEDKLSWREVAFAMVIALVLSVVFFIVLPVYIASFSLDYLGFFGRSLVEGLLRIGLFLLYIIIIRRLSDVARVFQYHGAEHKTINALEKGLALNVENVQKQSCINVRCGTSFVLMSMIMMVIVFTFVGNAGVINRILTKIVLMPVVMGVAFELFRLPLRFPNSRVVKVLVTPGLWLQRLTTKEPTGDQIEVAITALLKVDGFNSKPDDVLPLRVVTEAEYEEAKQAKDNDLADVATGDNNTDNANNNTGDNGNKTEVKP